MLLPRSLRLSLVPLAILALCVCLGPNRVGRSQVAPAQAEALAATIASASQAYDQKQYERSLELYTAALRRGAKQSTVPYNAACSAALCGKRDRAFDLLRTALEFGWMNVSHLRKDSDLASLRGDPRWPELVEAMQRAIEAVRKRWKSKAFQTPYSDNLTDAEKAAGLSKLWSEVKYNFVNFHLVPDLDWDAEYMKCMPKVLATESTIEYYRLLERLVAKLRDGHTNVYLPPQLDPKHNARPAMRTVYLEGKVLVSKILDARLEAKGIAIGQELLSIDRMPVVEYAAKVVRPFMAASTKHDRDRRTFEQSLLRGRVGSSVALELRKESGESFSVTVDRVAGRGRLARFLSRSPAFEMKVLDGNLAYVKLNSFSGQTARTKFARAFDAIAKTDGLILDLRQNGGGNSGIGRSILGYLTDERFRTTRWYTLQYRPTNRAWNRQPLSKHGSAGGTAAPHDEHYAKPVVMLIGGNTFSAAEDMAAGFDMLGRGKLIGQPTGGSTGQPLMFALPGGGRARVCTKHDSYADGTEFVGVGIQPDIAVVRTVADLRKGIDRTLEVAVEQLRK